MMNSLEYKAFWDKNHSDNVLLWLTGSRVAQVFELHRLTELFNINFMDIGVGMGEMCRHQHSLGNQVYAVDISEIALQKIKDFSRAQIFINDLVKVEPNLIDLAVCHLVMQHCNDEMCKYIIDNVYNALKPNGVFSIQFAGVDNVSRLDNEIGSDVQNGFFRSPHKMMELTKDISPDEIMITRRISFPKTPVYWHIMQIKK